MPTTLFTGGRVLDSVTGTVPDGNLLIEDGRIVDATGIAGTAAADTAAADTVVDVSGRILLPGLFDCHVHLGMSHLDAGETLYDPYSLRHFETVANLRYTLSAGITTVRDAGFTDAGVKRAVELGLVEGPRMRIAVTLLGQTGGHGDGWLASGASWPEDPGIPEVVIDGVDSARRAVREVIRAGADQIKIATTGGALSAHTDFRLAQLRADELAEIVAEASAAGRDVMAHAHAASGVLAAVRAGVRSIEHGTFLTDEAVALMAERGTYLVPTLSAPHGVLEAADAGARLPAGSEAKTRQIITEHATSFRRALDAGVPIAMGTDSPVWPHGRNLDELARMVEAGMTPMQAWQSTTLVAARLMRLEDELGSLEPGKRADVVVLAGDPDDVTELQPRIEQVWKDGVRVR